MYGIPNFILPLVAGILFDKIGIKIGLTVFFSITIVGIGCQVIGGHLLNFNMMILGYTLYGLGAESSYIALYLILVKYFTHFEFSFANGMLEVLPLCAEYAGAAIVPFVYKKYGFELAFAVGFLVLVCNFVLMILMFTLDFRVEKHDKKLLTRFKSRNFQQTPHGIAGSREPTEVTGDKSEEEAFKFSDLKKLKMPFWLLAISYMLTIMCVCCSILISSKVL